MAEPVTTWDQLWDRVSETVEGMDTFERGMYWGLAEMAFYAQAQKGSSGPLSLSFDPEDMAVGYSPSGQEGTTESFYSPSPPPAPDRQEYRFDLRKFLAVAAEIDREGAIYYIDARLDETPEFGHRYLHIDIHCTEDEVADSWLYPEDEKEEERRLWRDFDAADRIMADVEKQEVRG